MGAPLGNKNAVNKGEWTANIRWALKHYHDSSVKRGKALREIAYKLVAQAVDGDKEARREIGDRLDGKPAQALVGADGESLQLSRVERVVVEFNPPEQKALEGSARVLTDESESESR